MKNTTYYDKSYFVEWELMLSVIEKDEDGYNQLFNVIKKWRSDIRELSSILDEDIKEMEETVDSL